MNKAVLVLLFSLVVTLTVGAQIGGGLMFPGPGGVAGGAAAPSIPSGANFWYSADCITYTSSVCAVPSDGTSVTSWADRSGNGNNATKAAGTCTFNTNQINSQPAITFSSCRWTVGTPVGPGGGTWTIFVVVKLNATGSNYEFVSCAAGGSCPNYNATSTGPKEQSVFISGGGLLSGTASQDTSWHQLNVLLKNSISGNAYAFRRDGATDGSGSTGTNATGANDSIGGESAGAYLNGQMAEVIYYNSTLTGTQITQVETYLNTKYGL